MNFDEALALVDRVLEYDRLNFIQAIVLHQSWQGMSYREIAKSSGYEVGYIKDAGYKLWQLLSKYLGEKVTKNNFQTVLKRYSRRQCGDVTCNVCKAVATIPTTSFSPAEELNTKEPIASANLGAGRNALPPASLSAKCLMKLNSTDSNYEQLAIAPISLKKPQPLTNMSNLTLTEFGVTIPPTQDELPYDDGIPMETQRHKTQMDLLTDSLLPWLGQRADGYVGGNMFVYFSLEQVRNQDFRGPDFFAVLGVPKGERKSWVVWEEGKGPDVVIELLSDSTATFDKNEKKLIYQNQLRVPEYFWFDPFNPDDWAGFILNGAYRPLTPNDRNQLVSQSLGLGLQRWQGNYKGIDATWLRWATLEGELLPTPEELERQRAEQERQRADRSQSHLQQTVQNLRREGMTVEQVARLTGLSEVEVEQLGT